MTTREAERLRIENEELAVMAGLDDHGQALALNAGLRLLLGIEPDEPVWVALRLPDDDSAVARRQRVPALACSPLYETSDSERTKEP